MASEYPASKGWAIDFHEGLRLDDEQYKWIQMDINRFPFSEVIGNEKADLVFAITVIEHVQNPDEFVFEMMKMVEPQSGVIYASNPDFGSISRKVLRSKWPYFLPGEHIQIPSIKGARVLLNWRLAGWGVKCRPASYLAIPFLFPIHFGTL
jgi:hypothetical protein